MRYFSLLLIAAIFSSILTEHALCNQKSKKTNTKFTKGKNRYKKNSSISKNKKNITSKKKKTKVRSPKINIKKTPILLKNPLSLSDSAKSSISSSSTKEYLLPTIKNEDLIPSAQKPENTITRTKKTVTPQNNAAPSDSTAQKLPQQQIPSTPSASPQKPAAATQNTPAPPNNAAPSDSTAQKLPQQQIPSTPSASPQKSVAPKGMTFFSSSQKKSIPREKNKKNFLNPSLEVIQEASEAEENEPEHPTTSKKHSLNPSLEVIQEASEAEENEPEHPTTSKKHSLNPSLEVIKEASKAERNKPGHPATSKKHLLSHSLEVIQEASEAEENEPDNLTTHKKKKKTEKKKEKKIQNTPLKKSAAQALKDISNSFEKNHIKHQEQKKEELLKGKKDEENLGHDTSYDPDDKNEDVFFDTFDTEENRATGEIK